MYLVFTLTYSWLQTECTTTKLSLIHKNKNNPILEIQGLCSCHNGSLWTHTAWSLGSDSWPCLMVTAPQWSVKGVFSSHNFDVWGQTLLVPILLIVTSEIGLWSHDYDHTKIIWIFKQLINKICNTNTWIFDSFFLRKREQISDYLL